MIARTLKRWSLTTPVLPVSPCEGVAQAGYGEVLPYSRQASGPSPRWPCMDLLQRVLHRGHLRNARPQHDYVFEDVLDYEKG
jgi:hypothetical protein